MTTTEDYTEHFDEMLEWLDESPWRHDAWQVLEEAARTCSLSELEPNNLHLAGRLYGLASALQVMHDKGETGFYEGNVNVWLAFIADFAEDNYERGERIA